MEIVWILRQLWPRRLSVAVGFALAVVVGLLLAYDVHLELPPNFQHRQYEVGLASAAMLIDSHSSQVVDLGVAKSRADVATLSVRARLLADLLASSPLKDRIARGAGVRPETLLASAPTDLPATAPRAGVDSGAIVDPSDPRASTLNLSVRDAAPIITVVAQAPTRALAGRLAGATVTELHRHLESVAANDRVPRSRRLVVEPLGSARTATVTRGPRRLLAVGGAVGVLFLWCVGILLTAGLKRGWQRAIELEAELDPGPARPPVPPAADSAPEITRAAPQPALEPRHGARALDPPPPAGWGTAGATEPLGDPERPVPGRHGIVA